jgi:hypothetical protein
MSDHLLLLRAMEQEYRHKTWDGTHWSWDYPTSGRLKRADTLAAAQVALATLAAIRAFCETHKYVYWVANRQTIPEYLLALLDIPVTK